MIDNKIPARPFFSGLRNRRVALLFVLPATLTLLAITIFPLIYELRLSFMSWELAVGAEAKFIGLKNFATILTNDKRFWSSLKVTSVFMTVGVAVQLSLGTGIALLLNRVGRLRTLLASLFLISVMIAPVVAGFQFRMIYHDQFGPLNYVIEVLTFGRWRGKAWIADPQVALFAILMVDVWQWTPFLMLIVLAGLQSIPVEMYEAAEVDGASYWQRFWRIVLPQLLPVIVIGILIRVMDTFKLLDTHLSLIIANTIFNLPFVIWLLKGFFDELPVEMEEAAWIEGCSHWETFRRISLPLIAPGVVTAALFSFIFTWNEFMFALLLTRRNVRTFTIIVPSLVGGHEILWGEIAAIGTI